MCPLLRDLEFSHNLGSYVIGGDAPTIRVQLRHLERLRLSSDFCRVFALLDLLEIPDKMDSQRVHLYGCSPLHISQTIGPYFGDLVRRRGRIPNGGIGLMVQCTCHSFYLGAGDTRVDDDSGKVVWFAEMWAIIDTTLEDKEVDKLCSDPIAHVGASYQLTNESPHPALGRVTLRGAQPDPSPPRQYRPVHVVR